MCFVWKHVEVGLLLAKVIYRFFRVVFFFLEGLRITCDTDVGSIWGIYVREDVFLGIDVAVSFCIIADTGV